MTGQLVTVTDVTERESYRQRLEEKTEQLEALNRVVRHDIRNDMAVILGWAEILEDHINEDGEEALERVLQKSRHVIQFTEVARDFVESLSMDGDAELTETELQPLLESELAAVRDSFPNAQFHVSGELPDVTVQANEMLSSVFRNVLENAVRHNDKETPAITVTSEVDPETVRVRIADNGPGIPDDRKEQIFGKGEKGLDSPGSGIGLYLVHLLTDQFGGEVWVEDNNPNGSVFVVELPIHMSPNKVS
jgi:signal transduction histidine kinase